jgi:hypothetical protein
LSGGSGFFGCGLLSRDKRDICRMTISRPWKKREEKRNSLKHRANGRYGYPTHIVARLLLFYFLAVLFLFWLEGTSRGNWNVKTKKKSGICRRANTCFIMRWKTTNKPKKTIRKTKGKCQKERPLAGMRCFTVSLCVCVGLLMDSPPDWRPQTTARVCNREKK